MSTNETEAEEETGIEKEKSTNPSKIWVYLSDEVKELLISMLSLDPYLRPSIEDIINHEWLNKSFYEEIQYNLYSEMIHRKNYLSAFPRRKTKPF